ncbi:hypothetical protein [Paenibacillus urinalis]|uniref:hypothetical protein n=1 Tax=Paenibacillus urinalis TaxID=521520 RepID=UPI001961BC71
MNKRIRLKTNRARNVIIAVLMLLLILVYTCPTQEDYYAWLHEEHGISCDQYNYLDGLGCVKDGQMVLSSGTTFSGMIFTKREREYKHLEDGTVYKVNTVEFLNTIF